MLAPTSMRPDQTISVPVTLLKLENYHSFTVRAVVKLQNVDVGSAEICSVQETLTHTGTKILKMKVCE